MNTCPNGKDCVLYFTRKDGTEYREYDQYNPGTGRYVPVQCVHEDEPKMEDCYVCGGSGTIVEPCTSQECPPECENHGEVTCGHCNGTGRAPC